MCVENENENDLNIYLEKNYLSPQFTWWREILITVSSMATKRVRDIDMFIVVLKAFWIFFVLDCF